LGGRNWPLAARDADATGQFLAIELLASSILLDDQGRGEKRALVRAEALLASQALTPSSNSALGVVGGVDDAGIFGPTVRAPNYGRLGANMRFMPDLTGRGPCTQPIGDSNSSTGAPCRQDCFPTGTLKNRPGGVSTPENQKGGATPHPLNPAGSKTTLLGSLSRELPRAFPCAPIPPRG